MQVDNDTGNGNGTGDDDGRGVVNHRSLWLALTLFRVLEHEAWAQHPRWRRWLID